MKADYLRKLASDLNEPDTYHLGQILTALASFMEGMRNEQSNRSNLGIDDEYLEEYLHELGHKDMAAAFIEGRQEIMDEVNNFIAEIEDIEITP